MNNVRKLALINIAAFIIALGMNYIFPSSQNVGNVADALGSIIQPEGYAFSIWGFIYLLITIWIIRMFFANDIEIKSYKNIGGWFAANILLNSLWILVFENEWIGLSIFVILGVFLTVLTIYLKIESIPGTPWWHRLPFSAYLGWITVAVIVNVFAWMNASGIESFLGLDELTWTIIMLIVATLVTLFVTLRHRDIMYPLIVIWAFVGIIVKEQDRTGLVTLLWILIASITLGVVYQIIRFFRSKTA
ncbi:tryptophan-rich sensory protein [Alkalicoccobacillus plakortidis]|uniref:Tryptophan-rich sensory protein n=1 Tax=Alkalicoccobacillus plakortidis TaxID=444060 RepID=A0ABT0XED3_9BACI|nr:tryptophan-rich sensory protein [Alkalicoccobacillus plakortidis]MCM2674237.1 tryptophan-rich sensory protein [Alkalicoccobacillus plakortidis]